MPGTLLPRLQPARYGAVALFFACSLHAADWITLRGAGVELVSDTSEKTARAALQRLAEIRAILPLPTDPDALPLRVLLFAKESEYRAYAPNATADGFYQSGLDYDYIAMRAGVDLPRVAAHEYTHFAMHQQGVTRPAWLEEGLAEFYSNYDGRQLGRPIPEHLRLLEGRWLSAEEMNRPDTLDQLFYAQSWALVHMLRREVAFPVQVTPKMLDQLRVYIKSMRGQTAKAQAAPITASVEPVSPLNALLLRADLALHAQKSDVARALYSQAAREFPNSSSAATGLAALAAAEGDPEAARNHLRRALELNDRDSLAWFQLGMLETNNDMPLMRAAELNPNLGEAHVLLGVRATDDGNLDLALRYLEHATRVLPRKSYAWYSLGYAQWKHGDAAGAQRSLEQALQSATTPEQRLMAATLLDSLRNN